MDFRGAVQATGAERQALIHQQLAAARWEYLLADVFPQGWPEGVQVSNIEIQEETACIRVTFAANFTQRSPTTCEGNDYCQAMQTALELRIDSATGEYTLAPVNAGYLPRGEVY